VRLERISEKAVERMPLQMTRIVLAVAACFGKNTMVCADSTADVRWCMRMSSASTLSRVSDKS
jgi:di/tricarboxylate transporter